jgi:hypothetical protein
MTDTPKHDTDITGNDEGGRELYTTPILGAAARRDAAATQRDEAADRRDFDAAVHQWMQSPHDPDQSQARTEAREDRVASREDRRAAELDRTDLAAPPPASTGPGRGTVQQAVVGAVERIKAPSHAIADAAECVRCHRPAPDRDSAEFLQWDPVGDEAESLICPDCLTEDEETATEDKPAVEDVKPRQPHGYL